ncbi:MAG: methionyl-tRNA formyltransferase [Anaerolineales bacterium]
MRIVFMGSPDFAVPSLEAIEASFEVTGVITQPDRPAGRGRSLRPPAVKRAAQALGLPVFQPNKMDHAETLRILKDWEPDVIIVAAYGKILPPEILSAAPHGSLNVHASLLPRWRGAAPVQAAILHGDKKTGVTIMQMDPGLDTGPILTQRETQIKPDETGGELFNRLAPLGAELLVETLPPYLAGEIDPIPQDDSQATYAPMLKKSDGRLDFAQDARRLERQVRAYNPWPGCFFFWKKQRHLVHEAMVIDESFDQPAGTGVAWRGHPGVVCGRATLILSRIQPAGKRPMDGTDFLHGAQDFAGAYLMENGSGMYES